jgi:hypothetical protein
MSRDSDDLARNGTNNEVSAAESMPPGEVGIAIPESQDRAGHSERPLSRTEVERRFPLQPIRLGLARRRLDDRVDELKAFLMRTRDAREITSARLDVPSGLVISLAGHRIREEDPRRYFHQYTPNYAICRNLIVGARGFETLLQGLWLPHG